VAAGPAVGRVGRRVTPPESSAWIVGRASATAGVESSGAGARLNFGGPESSESRCAADCWGGGAGLGAEEADDEAERRRAIVAELLGSTEALVGVSPLGAGEDAVVSEPEDALRNFGRSLSLLLLSSELDVARRSFG
jgi:hypothetical protein